MRHRAPNRSSITGGTTVLARDARSLHAIDEALRSRFAAGHLWWPFTIGTAATAIWMASGLDFRLADQIYALEGGRWALKSTFITEDVIHLAGRSASAVAWLAALVALLLSHARDAWSQHRRPLACLLLSTLAGTLLVAWIKSWSNVDCPWDLARYGGARPYIDFLSLRPVGLGRGACFPAGHASGGYIWFAIYFFLLDTRPRWRWWGLLAGLLPGAMFGISQQLRGAHFMSHDLATATICWCVCAMIHLLMRPRHADPGLLHASRAHEAHPA